MDIKHLSHNKGTEKQIKAYDKAVESAAEYSFQRIKKSLKNAKDKALYLKSHIRELHQKIEKIGNDIPHSATSIAQGNRNFFGFTKKTCNKILSTDSPQNYIIGNQPEEGGEWKENETFNLAVCLELDKKLRTLKKPDLDLSDKIENWINSNIPKSPNKEEYRKAFETVVLHPNPDSLSPNEHIKRVRKKHDIKLGDQSLRKKIKLFIRDLPL